RPTDLDGEARIELSNGIDDPGIDDGGSRVTIGTHEMKQSIERFEFRSALIYPFRQRDRLGTARAYDDQRHVSDDLRGSAAQARHTPWKHVGCHPTRPMPRKRTTLS